MKSKVLSFFVNLQYSDNMAVSEINFPGLNDALAEGYEVKDIKQVPYGDTSYVTIVLFTLVKTEA